MLNPVSELLDAITYENFFLEQVYRLTASNGPTNIDIELSYTDNCEPRRKAFSRSYIDLSDWRPGFISAGMPLIFITTFKILDSIFEWLIKTPFKAAPLQIEQKLEALKKLSSDHLPELFKSETWLFERLVALYQRTAHLRNTLIHRGDFEVLADRLHVRLGKVQSEKERTAIKNVEVASFVALILTVIRLIAGVSTLDVLARKRVRWLCDALISLHEQESLGQRQVQVGRVKLAFPEIQDIAFDLSQIREDISPIIPVIDIQKNSATLKYDTVFDIHVVIGNFDNPAEEFLIPYNELDKYPSGIPRARLLRYKLQK